MQAFLKQCYYSLLSELRREKDWATRKRFVSHAPLFTICSFPSEHLASTGYVWSDHFHTACVQLQCELECCLNCMPFGLSSGGPTSRKLPVILVAVVGVLRVYFYWALRSEHLMIYYDVLVKLDIAWESHQACERGSDLTWIVANSLLRTHWNFCVGRGALCTLASGKWTILLYELLIN